ncbi:MAG: IS200/IS605 family transposase [Melioribacteraceae bacterium]
MPFVRVWVHLIWSTKNREKMISSELRNTLLDHIKSNSKIKEIWIDTINCISDHIHILVSLKADQSISKTVMLIKGESSFWVNKNKLTRTKFEWQDEYFAISVSESIVSKVRSYIRNQEEHHHKKSFSEEYDDLMKRYQNTVAAI